MLPAWATLALTLGTAFIGAVAGIAGTLAGISLRGRMEREAEWRTRMANAAENFFRASFVLDQKLRDAANYALAEPVFRSQVSDYSVEREREVLRDAVAAGDMLHAELASVELFFGHDSDVADVAGLVLRERRHVLHALNQGSLPDYAESLRSAIDAQRALRRVLRAALER